MDNQLLHKDITDKILRAAVAVHKALGPGLKEPSYQAAMAMEFCAMGVAFQREPRIAVTYRGAVVGHHIPDFIVENAVVVDLKAVAAIDRVFTTQVLTYLRLTNLRVGLIVNFNVEALGFGIKRVVR